MKNNTAEFLLATYICFFFSSYIAFFLLLENNNSAVCILNIIVLSRQIETRHVQYG